MRKKIVAGNWKMNKSLEEGKALANELHQGLSNLSTDVEVILGVPFIHLSSVADIMQSQAMVSAQDCSKETSGAFTGQISASMVASTGAKAVVLGHSERRMQHAENNALLADKVNISLSNHLQVIYCCGEVLEERESNHHFKVVESQVKEGLFHLTEEQMLQVVIAYEPVWAIGTGVTASSDQAQEMHAFIRQIVADKYGQEIAQEISILYGGSCKPSNAKDIFSKKDVDGGLACKVS
jgi:triosephosphate isomerase